MQSDVGGAAAPHCGHDRVALRAADRLTLWADRLTVWADPPTVWARTPTLWAVLPHTVGVFPHSVGEFHHTERGFPAQCDARTHHTVREFAHSVMTVGWSVPLGWYLRPSYSPTPLRAPRPFATLSISTTAFSSMSPLVARRPTRRWLCLTASTGCLRASRAATGTAATWSSGL